MEPERRTDVQPPMRRLNPTVIALLGGVVVLLLLIAYFATSRNSEQDKLSGNEIAQAQTAKPEKRCASQATYDLIKRELFRRAAQQRGSNQAAYDQLAGFAVARMENPVVESEDSTTGAVNCSGSLSLDLPPGIAAVGARHTLMADIDYTVDANGGVALRNPDAIIAPLASLTRVAPAPIETNTVAPEQPEANAAASVSANVQPGPPSAAPGRPSFDCAKARTRGEVAVCADSGLSALDLNMATQYRRALASASPEQQALLQQTDRRFYAYRDRCPDAKCIGDAYVGRMREIRDITEGRWRARR
jgi:uncharacterized protein YecT (DUF1311 family)